MSQISKQIKLLFLGTFISIIGCIAQQERPNILFVLCDDLGYNDIGFNGSKEIITPELDKLAKDGIIFTSTYVAHLFCGPNLLKKRTLLSQR